jgi:hypothetical protein
MTHVVDAPDVLLADVWTFKTITNNYSLCTCTRPIHLISPHYVSHLVMPKQPPISQQARRQNLKPLPTNTRKPARKSSTRLCACGCGDQVVARTERRHLEGKIRPSVFAKRKANATAHPTSPEPDDDIPGLLSENDSDDEENANEDSDVDMDSEPEEEIVAKVPMALHGAMEALKDLPAQEDAMQGSSDCREADVQFGGDIDFGGGEDIQEDPYDERQLLTVDVDAPTPTVSSPNNSRPVTIEEVEDEGDFGPQLEHLLESDSDIDDLDDANSEEEDIYDDDMDVDELEFMRTCAEYGESLFIYRYIVLNFPCSRGNYR